MKRVWHMRRYWVKAIVLAVVELDLEKFDVADRIFWNQLFEGAAL